MRRKTVQDLIRRSLVIYPGDTLVVRLDPKSTLERVHRCGEELKKAFPEIKTVVMGVDEIAVIRKATP